MYSKVNLNRETYNIMTPVRGCIKLELTQPLEVKTVSLQLYQVECINFKKGPMLKSVRQMSKYFEEERMLYQQDSSNKIIWPKGSYKWGFDFSFDCLRIKPVFTYNDKNYCRVFIQLCVDSGKSRHINSLEVPFTNTR